MAVTMFWPDETKWHFVMCVCVCVLGSGFQHGFHTGVVNTLQETLRSFINETEELRNGLGFNKSQMDVLWASVVSVYCLGATIGSLFISCSAETFGTKNALSANNVILLMGVALSYIAYYVKSYELVIIGRFVIGVNTGIKIQLHYFL